MLLRQLFEQSGKLRHLSQTSLKLDELNRLIKMALPDAELAQHVTLAKSNSQEIVLHIDSSAWATKVRYMLPDILKSLRIHPEFSQLENIRYKVASHCITTNTQNVNEAVSKPQISSKSRQLIQGVAQRIKNPHLRNALSKLAQ